LGDSDSEEDNADDEKVAEDAEKGAKSKGDVDTSSDEGEGDSEELSDSEDEDEKPVTKGKKGASSAAKPSAKTAKKI